MSKQEPTALDLLRGLHARHNELARLALPANLAADAQNIATTNTEVIKDTLADLAGEIDKLKHLVQRQQEELNKPADDAVEVRDG